MRDEDEMTDERAVRLLLPLREEPEGPARIDVARSMVEGRRRRVLRRWSGGAALIALTSVAAGGGTLAVAALNDGTPVPGPATTAAPSAVAAAPDVPVGCEVTRLPTDGVKKSLVTSGDPSGRYLAGRLYRAASNTILWRDGRILATPRVPGDDASFRDVNRSGVAVGGSFVTSDRQQAYVYRDGRVQELDGRGTTATAINDAGVIVGSMGPAYSGVPVRWDSAGAKVTPLRLPEGATTGSADGIAEDGTVVGSVAPDDGSEASGYLWLPDGTGRTMSLPPVDGEKATFFWPESIVDGWVAGRAVLDKPDGSRWFTAYRYRIADGTYEKVDGPGYPVLIAANGWVVSGTQQPVITADDRLFDLPLHPDADDYQISSISADGRVIGGSGAALGGNQVGNDPLMWTCR
ncbi:hypothetical protein [Actinoplanes subglobosus]|uniref:Uncharacterized protein n=1 Tax=Actinoplanes subglobosus TaxID=1547892 RepID=A0ABV8JFN6_9ACTN